MAELKNGDANHSIIKSFDESTDSLKTTIVNADVNINVSAFTDSIKIGDGTGNNATITNNGGKYSLDVNVTDITIDAANDSIAIKNGSNQMAVNTNGDINAGVTYKNFESNHQTLTAGVDTTVTFSQSVKFVRVTNWDIVNVILVKNGSISSNTDSTASRVGVAPAVNLSNSESFPITTSSIHIRSAGASLVTVEGFI